MEIVLLAPGGNVTGNDSPGELNTPPVKFNAERVTEPVPVLLTVRF